MTKHIAHSCDSVRRRDSRLAVAVLLMVMCPLLASAATTSQISQWGVTWTFSAEHEYGQFANGDYWVLGPVTITEMTPNWDGTHNGWEINPTFQYPQGFHGADYGYTSSLRPSLPLTVTSGSVVKVIGKDDSSHSVIRAAAVLTVLTEIPPNRGADIFRPPYSGSLKPLYPVSRLRQDLLPSFPPVPNAPTLAKVTADFSKCLRMDHHEKNARQMRPSNAMFDYQPKNGPELTEAMLRLMLDDSYSDKLPALIQFTQHALDRAYIILQGYQHAGTGHNPIHRIMAAWAGVMLDLSDIKDYLQTAEGFHEDLYLFQGINTVLWGTETSTEEQYWSYIHAEEGSRSHGDPYRYIDGGAQGPVGASYQNITSQALKGQALVGRLFPELRACFPAERWQNLNIYAERWVDIGTWTSPDPHNRYISLHGSNTDGGQYRSQFVASMWDAYADSQGSVQTRTAPPNTRVTSSTYSPGD